MLRVEAGRQTKVSELDMPAAVEENVVGFDVTGLQSQQLIPRLDIRIHSENVDLWLCEATLRHLQGKGYQDGWGRFDASNACERA